MLTFIIQLYGSRVSNDLHHHYHFQQPCRRHPQQQRHDSSQHSIALSPLCAHAPVEAQREHFVSATNVTSSRRDESAPFIGDALLLNCPAIFFILLVFMTSCSNAWGLPGAGHSVGLAGGSRRLAREVQASITPATSHSTYLNASLNPSISSSGTDIPGKQSSTHYTVSNEEGHTPVQPNATTRVDLINVLISTLEKLKVLQVTEASCFRLEKIVRKNIDGTSSTSFDTTTSSPSSGRNFLGVFLYFEEVPFAATDSSANVNVSSQMKSGLHETCEMEPVVELEGRSEPRLVVAAEEGVLNGNTSMIVIADEEGSTTEMGISRTHIVVISTCSAIIGMFFLVAAFLRIRNYIKRARLEQEMSNRPKFRSCSVALRGATQSMEQLRRDSMISKTSHQHSDTTKGSNGSHTNGSSRENSSSSSPRHDPDTATLLLLPRVSDPSAPAEVEACLQLVDEDTTAAASMKKMKSPTFLANNDNSSNTTENRSQVSAENILEGVISFNGSARTPAGGSDTLVSSRENGQLVSGHSEGNVNPSFSSGSLRYNLLTSSDDEYLKVQSVSLNTINKPQTNPDNIPRRFAEANSVDTDSGQIIYKIINGDTESNSKLQISANDEDPPHQTARGQPGDDIISQSGVRQTSVSKCLREENNPNSLGQKVQRVAARNRGQNVDLETGNTLNPAVEFSYFGLSRSDVSLSSVTNQGNEFFGQTEYQLPIEGFVDFETICSDAINRNECNNNLDIVDSGEVGDVNKIKMDTHNPRTAQDCQLRSSVDTSCAELADIDTEIEILPVNVSHADSQTIIIPPATSPAFDEPLVCNRGIKETEQTDNMFTKISSHPAGLADPHNCDSFPATLSPSGGGSSFLSHHPFVTMTHQSADLTDLASNAADLASLEPELESCVCPSVHPVGNESSTDEILFLLEESGSCQAQSVLPATSHETLGMLPLSSSDLVSSHVCQADTEISGECVLQPHNHISLIEAPLPGPDHPPTEGTHAQPVKCSS